MPRRTDRRRMRLVWAVGPVALGLATALLASPASPLARLTPLVFDSYQRLMPRPSAGAPLAVLDIDETSIAAIGQWPWSRGTLARMVDRLGELGAVTIAFDMVFPEPDRTSPVRLAETWAQDGIDVPAAIRDLPDTDALFAAAIARNPVVAGLVISSENTNELPRPKAGFSFAGADPKSFLPAFTGGVPNLSVLDAGAPGLGFFSFPPSRDGIVRVLPLVANARGTLYPSLSLEALRLAQGAGSFVVRATGAGAESDTGEPAITAVRAGDLDTPTGPSGEVFVWFSGLSDMPTVSAARLLASEPDPALEGEIGGRIVLVGTSAVGLRDLVPTPVDASLPGVRMHAEIIDQIIGGQFLIRPDFARGAEIAMALAAGLVLVAIAAMGGALPVGAATLALLAATLGASWFAFARAQYLIDPILPSAAILATFAVVTPVLLLLTDREKRFVRNAFGHYLSPTLVERLAHDPAALKLGGETRELTVLFSDIRGFTGLSEKLQPDELTALLNGFLTPMTEILLQSEATIDKYMGDAIMAFWNAPLPIEVHPAKACAAALAMVEGLERMNTSRATPLKIGIGLNTGIACVGNLGSTQRFSYSAIGDAVNLASRVEGLTKQYGVAILVTEDVRAAAGSLAFLEIDLVRVVGRLGPVPVHALLGNAQMAASAGFAQTKAAQDRMIAAFRAGDWAETERALDAARKISPQMETLNDLYARRLDAMRHASAPAGWSGVFDAKEK